MSHILILGGVRSGKSALAEALLREEEARRAAPVSYLATAEAGDAEMSQRIRRHRAQRPAHWGLIEEPIRLGQCLDRMQERRDLLLIDCMSLWVSNLLMAGEESLPSERDAFLKSLAARTSPVVIVSNEVGLGTIGMDALTRRFCDELGELNQSLAGICQQVYLSVAGIPMQLKGQGA